MKLWPYKREIIERGQQAFIDRYLVAGVQIGEPIKYVRQFVIYKITNQWTGSERLEKKYLN